MLEMCHTPCVLHNLYKFHTKPYIFTEASESFFLSFAFMDMFWMWGLNLEQLKGTETFLELRGREILEIVEGTISSFFGHST